MVKMLSQNMEDLNSQMESTSSAALNPAEKEAIAMITDLAAVLGLPKSVAQIYGLLFVSPVPICLDEMTQRLEISKGSASQGLRLLTNLGAIQPVVLPHDRRTFHEAETRLKILIPSFIKNHLLPRLENWPGQIDRLEAAAETLSSNQATLVHDRAKQLRTWVTKANFLLPLLMKSVK